MGGVNRSRLRGVESSLSQMFLNIFVEAAVLLVGEVGSPASSLPLSNEFVCLQLHHIVNIFHVHGFVALHVGKTSVLDYSIRLIICQGTADEVGNLRDASPDILHRDEKKGICTFLNSSYM